jgi:hypothetical protein
MKIQDLRVGNYLRDTLTGIERPATFKTLDAINYGRGIYDGIPLTEEWLVRLGFKHSYKSIDEMGDIVIELENENALIYRGLGDEWSYGFKSHIKYVHQLQNLYHALTGQELTIKPI